jgi:DNA-binding transcriptional LysR family regulator
MSDIRHTQLRRLDMTLLLVFREIVRTGKASEAARRLGLTQSAISHALNRLRDLFSDPLFVRRPHGLEPTARALALAPQIDSILMLSEQAIASDRPFEPAKEQRALRIGAADDTLSLIAPPLIRRVKKAAPSVQLNFRLAARPDMQDKLASGDLDLGVGFMPRLHGAVEAKPVFRETYLVVARRGHPKLAEPLTLGKYLDLEHLLVSFGGDARGIVDQVLEQKGKSRLIGAVMPMFLPAVAAIAETDLVATLPSRVAQRFAPRFKLATAPPPLAIRSYQVSIAWRRVAASDHAVQWLASQIQDVLTETNR